MVALSPGSPIFSVCNIEKLGLGPGNEATLWYSLGAGMASIVIIIGTCPLSGVYKI